MSDAAQVLERIKAFCSPAIDRGDAHGARNQSGRILWENQEAFAVAAIEAALTAAVEAERALIVAWAVSRWEVEVKNRPLQNVHRRALDDTWRQVIRHYGGDHRALCGPTHDELLDNPSNL